MPVCSGLFLFLACYKNNMYFTSFRRYGGKSKKEKTVHEKNNRINDIDHNHGQPDLYHWLQKTKPGGKDAKQDRDDLG